MQKTIFFSNDTIKHLHQKLKRQQTGSFSETPEISEIAQSSRNSRRLCERLKHGCYFKYKFL